VTFQNRSDCFAVITPMRQQTGVTEWNVARAIA